LKTNLFQGCWDAVAVGIQQLRASASELRETLQEKAAAVASLAARPS
jgi:DNA-binding winged helix-turn-helix (wHTH) protein